MIRLLHLADVHLGASMSSFGDLAEARREAVLDAFRALPDAAAEEEVHAVLVAGDLFDSAEPPEQALAVAIETFRRLAEGGWPVVVVPGNHDAASLHPNPWGEDLGGARVFLEPRLATESVDTEAGPLHVHGLAFDGAIEPDPLAGFEAGGESGVHVALLHGSVPDAPHWEGAGLRLPVEELAGLGCDYVALGDHHRFRPPEEFGEGSAPACYAGSFAAVDTTETGPRGFVVAEVEAGEPPRVEHRSSGVAPVQDLGAVDVGGRDTVGEVAEAVAERAGEGAIPRVRLVGTPGVPLDEAAVRKRLEERFGHVDLRDETRYYASSRLDELAGRDTVAGHVVRMGRERIERAGSEPDRRVAERALRIALDALGVE
ncbi:MAG: DNA repair exonuclease [Gemmatimonadota bacterium]|nr:DNA repair exonuclease [Gemmatimonadota bacterium]